MDYKFRKWLNFQWRHKINQFFRYFFFIFIYTNKWCNYRQILIESNSLFCKIWQCQWKVSRRIIIKVGKWRFVFLFWFFFYSSTNWNLSYIILFLLQLQKDWPFYISCKWIMRKCMLICLIITSNNCNRIVVTFQKNRLWKNIKLSIFRIAKETKSRCQKLKFIEERTNFNYKRLTPFF